MGLVVTAIAPIMLLLGGGAILRRRFLPEPTFWRGLEWISYHVFTPALFVTAIAAADLSVVPVGPLALSLSVPITAVAVVVLSVRRPLHVNGPRLSSMVQGSIRFNTYIGLVFASALHGAQGLASFALASAVVVPLVNVISVSALAAYGDRGSTTMRSAPLWRELVTNPLIQGCLIGLALNLSGTSLPGLLSSTLSMLADPALVCGTLIAGGALTWQVDGRDVRDIGLTSVLKLVVLPLSAAAIAISLGVTGATLTSIVLISAVPTAPSAYVLASRMGGDTHLMASITGVQTVLSLAALPLVLTVVRHVAQATGMAP